MVDISQETPEQIDQRLRQVIADSTLVILDGDWSFQEAPLDQPPALNPDVLAVVRDEDSWSCLTPASAAAAERFALFSFHFPTGVDNSGFVGWLASELKRSLGTGSSSSAGRTARGEASTTTGVAPRSCARLWRQ